MTGDRAADARPELLRVICGPTAAGKSAVAAWLADRFPLAVLSADSRQVYRGFDLGTAKPTAVERARVPHFGIDVADPTERYSAARWAASCEEWLASAAAMGRDPVVVGGTGLYLRALAAPLFDEPPLDPGRRAALAAAVASMSTVELRRWVAALDPARAHLGRAQLLRAAEVALLSGRRQSDLHRSAARAPKYRLRYLLVDPGRDALREWIAVRTDAMLAAGWADEVRALAGRVPDDAPAWQGTGYDVLREHVRGALSLAEARERVVVETRQYAKRQRTWFRHQLAGEDVMAIDPRAPDALDRVAAWWRGGHPTFASDEPLTPDASA